MGTVDDWLSSFNIEHLLRSIAMLAACDSISSPSAELAFRTLYMT
jgi:hypothetical protein